MIQRYLLNSVYIFIFFNIFPINVIGQEAKYNSFSNTYIGVESSVVSCFLQDTQGMLWFGTNKGLFSYDGFSSQPHFKFGQHTNTYIYCGVVVDDTYLYLGADNGMLIYNYRTDQYENIGVDFPSDIRTMAKYDDMIYIGTLKGMYSYNPLSRKLSSIKKGLPHQTIYSLTSCSDHNLYVGTYNGCCRYNSVRKKFEQIALPAMSDKSNMFVNAIFEDTKRKCIWIGTEGNLYKYYPQINKTERVNSFCNNSVKSLAVDGYGDLLIGTDNGLYVYSDNDCVQHIVHDSRNSQSLINNIIWNIFVDKEHNVWLGTDYGISMAKYNHILTFVSISQITGSGEGNRFYSIYRDVNNNFWFGGTDGLIRFTYISNKLSDSSSNKKPKDVSWYKMGDKTFTLPHNRVRYIYEDNDKDLWVTTDGGINRYDKRRSQFITYHIVDRTHHYNANWAYGIFEDEFGQLWISTCLGGIFVVDKKKLVNSRTGYYVADKTYSIHNGLSGMFVNQMVSDNKGNVWALFYSSNLIDKINIATGKIEHISAKQIGKDKIPNYLLCSDDGNIWMGYPGGLICISSTTSKVCDIKFDSYGHYDILAMVEVEDMILVSTTDGLWYVNQKTLKAKRLNISDDKFTSMWYDKRSRDICFGTTDGYAISSLSSILSKSNDKPLLLTAIYINGCMYQPSGENRGESIRYIKSLTLNSNQNNLTFEFSDLPYSLDVKNRFLCKLEGVDEDWNLLPANTNKLVYNNLKYGEYTLYVTKLDINGKPLRKAYQLNITICPPWYYTWWAKSCYVIFILALIIWIINFFRVRNRLKLERVEKEKVLEQSRAKIDFFTNLSHDIKTPLSMIIAPISRMLPKVSDKSEKQQLELVHRNAMKLNALLHEGIDFNRIDNGSNAMLIISQIELVSFTHDIFTMYSQVKPNDNNLKFKFKTDRDRIYVMMDAIKLESIINNLLSNAVKYSSQDAMVELCLCAEEDTDSVSISVSDTGNGIPLQDQPYVFQRFFQSSNAAGKHDGAGIGLYLVKTYTELHKGKVRLNSQEGNGTAITLSLPVLCKEQYVDRREIEDEDEEKQTQLSDNYPLILIVDDNDEITSFIEQMLHGKYRCSIAKDGKEGVHKAIDLLPDLIVSDIMMPVMDGIEMVKTLKKNVPTSTIPVIFLTAKNDKETELESMQVYIDAFIAKPFEPDILQSRIEQLLHSREAHTTKARIDVIAQPNEIEAISYDEKFLSNVVHLIEEHISDSELNVNALCEWTSTNNKQMYRKIKQLTGQTPVEYIKSIRMKKAAMLLQQNKFSVAEVMYMVGFSSHSYFSKCFQTQFGVTPKQYQTK